MNKSPSFAPRWISPPGDTISELLRDRQISIHQFSQQLSQTIEETEALIQGRSAITLSIARKLQETVGGSVEFWMARDFRYRNNASCLNEQERSWLRELPLADVYKFGWIQPRPRAAEEAKALLNFFGVPSVFAWRAKYEKAMPATAFRSSQTLDSKLGAVAAWLRRGEIIASGFASQEWNAEKFRQLLPELRKLTRERSPAAFIPKIQEICAQAGVVVAAEPAPSGCRASGATMFLTASKAVILLSFRHLTDDHFWFTFFHECGHLLLHGNDRVFVDGISDAPELLETQANLFAAEVLIPASYARELQTLQLSAPSIARFAKKIGISPGIVVGQLQHLGRLEHRSTFSRLKRRYTWTDNFEIQPRKGLK